MYLELHRADLIQDLAHVLSDYGPGDFVVALSGGLHCVSSQVVKCNHVGEDANGFVEGTEPVDERQMNAHSSSLVIIESMVS